MPFSKFSMSVHSANITFETVFFEKKKSNNVKRQNEIILT